MCALRAGRRLSPVQAEQGRGRAGKEGAVGAISGEAYERCMDAARTASGNLVYWGISLAARWLYRSSSLLFKGMLKMQKGGSIAD